MKRLMCWLGFHSVIFIDPVNALRCLMGKPHVRWCLRCERDVYRKPIGWKRRGPE